MHALAVPTALLCNKALAIGLGCLVGVVLFDWPSVRRLRPIWLDAPMVAWCLVPAAAALANGVSLASGLVQSRYLVLAWGVPYLMGRLYLGDNESLRRLGLALVLAGLVYVPLGLLEFVFGPFLYSLVYGPHPYQVEGADRFVGYRPLVFLEHGNQLGIWIATAAVAAVWLWRSGRMRTVGPIPGGVAAAVLLTASLVFQSHGALILVLAALALLLPARRCFPCRGESTRPWLAGVLLLMLAAASAVVAAEGANWPALRVKVRGVFQSIGQDLVHLETGTFRGGPGPDRPAARPRLGAAGLVCGPRRHLCQSRQPRTLVDDAR